MSIRWMNCLSTDLEACYLAVAKHCTVRLGRNVVFMSGGHPELAVHDSDLAFLCGLPFVELKRDWADIVPVVAPIPSPKRYRGRPIYFSDIVVRANGPFDTEWRGWSTLSGARWAYNEPRSHSGYGVVRWKMAKSGVDPRALFSEIERSGSHRRSVELVRCGLADVSAVDSHWYDVVRYQHPGYCSGLRVLASIGPSPIQPLVAMPTIDVGVQRELGAILEALTIDDVPELVTALTRGFEKVDDTYYDVIRGMRAEVL